MLVAENITKKFSGVTALDRVCLELHAGKVNAIIGENGAGKSTLMKILSGVYADYDGQIIYKNRPIRFQNTRQAQAAGIAIIHQELNLIPYLSITENIFLGREITTSWGTLDKNQMRTRAKSLLGKLKLSVDPDTKISSLKVGQQQVIEIARALLTDAEVIIMDEPTSAISENEVEVLFGIIAQLKKDNKTIAYISHKLDELFKIADRYIVLRDGKTIESGDMQGMTHDNIIQKMVGREIKIVRRTQSDKNSNALLSVSNLSLKHPERKNDLLVKNISFNLNKGEILGIFGLMGCLIAHAVRFKATATGRELKARFVPWLIYGLILGFAVPGVDNAAHIGGLVAGAAVGWFLGEQRTARRVRGVWEGLAFATAVVVAASFVLAVRSPFVPG